YAFSGMQGCRVTQEDAHMVCNVIPVAGQEEPLRKGHAIFGVMDGHGGDFTSEFAADHFMRFFSSSNRLKKYANMSIEDQSNGSPAPRVKYERSGSTCIVVLVTPSHIISANAGDSRAILRRNGNILPLSFDHKPNNIPELERINLASGFVKCKRVDGDLAVSRGLGDFSYKSNGLLPVEQQKVIPNPEFVIYPRSKDDEFMVLACDGIWDVASNEQCGSFVQSLLDEGESDLGLICEESIDTCLDKNSRDNMTIAMV
ncbi:protein serine/threonine phosphatase 2C, partial [Fragilariopsis cylindrus CCMP1102]